VVTAAALKDWAADVVRGNVGEPPIVLVLRGVLKGVLLADRPGMSDAKLFEIQKAALQALEEAQR
jgi:hypothetical protein